MASDDATRPPSPPALQEHSPDSVYTKSNPWFTPVSQPTRFPPPSTPSSSASSSSFTLDEDDTYSCAKSDPNALKLLTSPAHESERDATHSTERKALSHSEWLHQFAEQARRAHMRNISGSPPSLNLDASPFVPAAFRPLDADDDFIYPRPPTAFRRGCITVDPKARRMYAQDVVALGSWDVDALVELVNKVTDRISEGYGEELAVLAPFARDLARSLAADVGAAAAETFKDLLRECVLTEFAVWWDMDFPTSVATLRYEFWGDTFRLFDIAFAVASFVGAASAQQLLPASAVHHCLALLVRKLAMLEQVQAVHAIVSNADAALYDGRALLLLMSVLKFRSERVPAGTSVLGEAFSEEDVRVYVKEIGVRVDGWVKAGPSSEREHDKSVEDPETDDVERASASPPAPRHPLRDSDSTDEVIPAHRPPTKQTRPAPLSYSDMVKKRKKT
ncbi:hypothetical protein EVJ58_g2207 [Rhodofomes roseus]|uniref:Uncharacterized protein n=1 Tax=Rhodofomes roseus TaxID=34475 RepID=A0A4Y9YS91_9APHY|nr:hypothetical protein EVJ58_g2207 [Rhodofomes roseus]